MYHRLGRWDDPSTTYATLDDSYIESVWWVFSQLNTKGLVYQGFKSMPYCPRCATPLSNFEVNDGYKDDVPDPSVFAKFGLKSEATTSLLAWTTTPWTLPANAALAVDAKAEYVTVELTSDGDGWKKGERLILAKKRLEALELRKAAYTVVSTQKGSDLVGAEYEPLFSYATITDEEAKTAWRVYEDASVSLDDGTGILHVAPRYGETDLELGQMVAAMKPYAGMFFKEADQHIIADLTKAGRIFAAETFEHTYPFCWRCETPLLYFAMPSWFIAVSQIRDKLVKSGEETTWIPGHVKKGRFVKWLEGARDWAVSRNRFWGAPIPIWQCDDGHNTVVGSLDELKKLAGLTKIEDLHRPGIDEVTLACSECGKEAKRIEEVFDCWFESGSMPYGQDHYPFEHKAEFDASFPADFVCEAIEQVHLWFYTLHVLAVAMFEKPAYQNIVATGLILGADGRKLSKRLRNYPPVEEVFAEYGADVLRYFILESPLMSAGDTRLSNDALRDVARNIFMTLWNVHSFFTMYAEIDKWKPNSKLQTPDSDNVLDQWMLARLAEVTKETTKQADAYHIARATRPLRDLIDDLSNWYVRRSRRRFWKSEDDNDKAQAYSTLHFVLVRMCQLLAPWSPFISDKLWRELTEGMDVPASVHLSDWPESGTPDKKVIEAMLTARTAVNEGLSLRATAGIKVRQPLAEAMLTVTDELSDGLLQIVADELNVKKVTQKKGSEQAIKLDTKLTHELQQEGMVRDLVRTIQAARKSTGLEVDDRITLVLGTASKDLKEAAEAFSDLIQQETLATSLKVTEPGESVPVKLGDATVTIDLAKD
jgi:isoleucyl-tRNA synthetase